MSQDMQRYPERGHRLMAKSVDHVFAGGHNMKGSVIAPADGPAFMG